MGHDVCAAARTAVVLALGGPGCAIFGGGPPKRTQGDRCARRLAVNLKGLYLCTRAVLPHMYERDYGKIINTASQLAYLGAPSFSHYCATKGATLSFTRSVALEIGSRNVRINCVGPGATMTPILEGVDPEVLKSIEAKIPRGRIARVEEIVSAANARAAAPPRRRAATSREECEGLSERVGAIWVRVWGDAMTVGVWRARRRPPTSSWRATSPAPSSGSASRPTAVTRSSDLLRLRCVTADLFCVPGVDGPVAWTYLV